MFDMLRGWKDKGLETAARRYLNGLAPDVGQVEHLAIDTGAKSIRARLRLQGAEAPVEISVGRYHLEQRGDRLGLRLDDVAASTPWLQALAGRLLAGREFEIPPEYQTLVAAAL